MFGSRSGQKFDNLEIRFYGPPIDREYLDSCISKVGELQLENCVSFVGPTNEPWRVYNDADVIAFPSVSEAFPYAVVEAMSCGSAVVASDVGGVREALGDCGLLVPARKPHAMAEAISFLLRDEAERRRLGHMARARTLKHFSEEQFLTSYENVYRKLISCGPRLLLQANS